MNSYGNATYSCYHFLRPPTNEQDLDMTFILHKFQLFLQSLFPLKQRKTGGGDDPKKGNLLFS